MKNNNDNLKHETRGEKNMDYPSNNCGGCGAKLRSGTEQVYCSNCIFYYNVPAEEETLEGVEE